MKPARCATPNGSSGPPILETGELIMPMTLLLPGESIMGDDGGKVGKAIRHNARAYAV